MLLGPQDLNYLQMLYDVNELTTCVRFVDRRAKRTCAAAVPALIKEIHALIAMAPPIAPDDERFTFGYVRPVTGAQWGWWWCCECHKHQEAGYGTLHAAARYADSEHRALFGH